VFEEEAQGDVGLFGGDVEKSAAQALLSVLGREAGGPVWLRGHALVPHRPPRLDAGAERLHWRAGQQRESGPGVGSSLSTRHTSWAITCVVPGPVVGFRRLRPRSPWRGVDTG
jgi:hypothetical protein